MGERRRGSTLPPIQSGPLDDVQDLAVRIFAHAIPWTDEAMVDAIAGRGVEGSEKQTLFGYPVEVIDGAEPGEFILRSVEPRVHITIPVRESVARRLEEDASLRERVEAELLAGLQEEIHRMVAEQVDELARGARTIAIARGILP